MNVSSDKKALEDTLLKPNDLDSPYALDHIFDDFDNPLVQDKHVSETPPISQTHPKSWINIHWDPSPHSSEHRTNDIDEPNVHIFTFDQIFFNIDDDI